MADFSRHDWPRFMLIEGFERQWSKLGLDDIALNLLQLAIKDDPAAAPVMKSCGGIHKVRFVVPGEGRGKSGAYRVAYLAYPLFGTIVLVTVWGKNEKANLSATECRAIAALAARLQTALEKGEI